MPAATNIRQLSGKSWREWPPKQKVKDSQKAIHESDACILLPCKDWNIYGQFPNYDDLVIVVCTVCQASVKIEAFSSHKCITFIKLREEENVSGSSNFALNYSSNGSSKQQDQVK